MVHVDYNFMYVYCLLMYSWCKDDRKFKTIHSATFEAYLTFSIIHCGYLEIIKMY